MYIPEDPEKALMNFESFEDNEEENRKILMEAMREEKEVEAIATAATLQLFNLEKLVEEEVAETGNNFDYIENLLDNRVEGERVEQEKDQVESGKKEGEETLSLALSEEEEEGEDVDTDVKEEKLVFTQTDPEDLEGEKDQMAEGKVRDEEEEQVKMQQEKKEEDEGVESSRKRKREEEEDEEVEGKRNAKRFCSWRTWVADIVTSWFNFNLGYFVHLYNGLSGVFVRRAT